MPVLARSVLGHTTLAEAERYTEDADQAGLAVDAVAMLEGHKANGIAQTTSTESGQTSKQKENQSEQNGTGAP